MIEYIGSKRALIPAIMSVITSITPSGSVIDLFSGTSRVGHALKRQGYRVIANDHNAYAETIAKCYVVADREDHEHSARQIIQELNALPGCAGYFTDTFCVRSRFFHPKNGERVDAIREEVARKGLEPELEAVIITALMEAADRVSSTTGVQMAYLKQWKLRALNSLEMRLPNLLPRAQAGKGEAWCLDALEAIGVLDADACYIDPPYNQRVYLGNYHIWESLVRWDKPEVYGVACKRVDCRERSSAFNAKNRALAAFDAIVQRARTSHLVVSFNDEGYLGKNEVEDALACRGNVITFAHDFKRYISARTDVHNLQGEKVRKTGHLRNTEYIFVATYDQAAVRRLIALGGQLVR